MKVEIDFFCLKLINGHLYSQQPLLLQERNPWQEILLSIKAQAWPRGATISQVKTSRGRSPG